MGQKSASPPEQQAAGDDGFLSTAMSALSEGQLTLNNPWTEADLEEENIGTIIVDLPFVVSTLKHEGIDQPPGRMRPYTTLVQQYRVRRKQCEEDAKVLNSKGEPTCYPVQTNRLNDSNPCPQPIPPVSVEDARFLALRYGYYCGAGFPDDSPFFARMPEPLDGVDYCCRLHDEAAWYPDIAVGLGPNECGIVMCLRQASGWPADITARLPDVEEARQCWYDWSAQICPGNQSNNAPPPKLGP